MLEDITIRPETVDDFPAVREVVNLAFQNDDEGEADLIDALRAEPGYTPELSLVAELNGIVVGHIIFSDAYIDTDNGRVSAISLGPLAVHPEWQQQGDWVPACGGGIGGWPQAGTPNRCGHRSLDLLPSLWVPAGTAIGHRDGARPPGRVAHGNGAGGRCA